MSAVREELWVVRDWDSHMDWWLDTGQGTVPVTTVTGGGVGLFKSSVLDWAVILHRLCEHYRLCQYSWTFGHLDTGKSQPLG